jgi:hypothetical protein
MTNESITRSKTLLGLLVRRAMSRSTRSFQRPHWCLSGTHARLVASSALFFSSGTLLADSGMQPLFHDEAASFKKVMTTQSHDPEEEREGAIERAPAAEHPASGDQRIVGDLVGSRPDRKSTGFFDKGSARSIFSPAVTLKAAPPLHMLRADEAEPQEAETPPAPGTPPTTTAQATPLPLKERLAQTYGNPEEEAPIYAHESAPRPFKALMEAMQAGDEELAYKYARQHVRYLRNMKERVMRVTNMNRYAMQQEGIIPKRKGEEEAPDYDGTRALYEKDLAEEEQKMLQEAEDEQSLLVSLDPRTAELLQRAEADEDQGVKNSRLAGTPAKIEAEPDEKSERQKARAAHGGRLLDPEGKVTVYHFINLAQTDTHGMIADIQKLHNKLKGSGNRQVLMFTSNYVTEAQLSAFRTIMKVKIPVRNGRELAKKLNISRSPTTIILSPTTGQGLREEGVRSFHYLDELVTLVGGSDQQKVSNSGEVP